MTRLLLCRHAEPEAWARERFCGALDVALSEAGLAEAEAIAAAHGLAVQTDARLSEIDFGELEGREFADVASELPDLYAEWLRAPTSVRFPGGEDYAELRARVVPTLAALLAEHPSRTIAVVTHAGVIRALLAEWLSIPGETVFSIDQRYASVNVVDWLDRPVVRLVNGRPGSRP